MEKLAEVLYALNPDRQPWDGDPFGFQEALRRREHRAQLALIQAEKLIDLGVIRTEQLHDLPTMWQLGCR